MRLDTKFTECFSSCQKIAVEHLVTKLAAQSKRLLILFREGSSEVTRYLSFNVFQSFRVSVRL